MPESWHTIEAQSITVTFGGVDVVRSVDLSLKGGEIHAITGENGAGKSSLAKVLAGVYKARIGKVDLNGKEVRFRSPREALKAGIALIHQEPLSFPELDIAENIFIGHQPGAAGFVGWATLYRRATKLLNELGVNLDPRAKVGGLSVAQQQMVELAFALSHNAKIWIFDETTAPLTPKEAEDLFVVMRKLKADGCAIAIVTHRLEEVFAISDRITVLRDGAKMAEKETAKTSPAEIVQLMVGRELSSERMLAPGPTTEPPILEISNLSGPGFHNVSFVLKPGEVLGMAGLVGAGRTEVARVLAGIERQFGGQIKLRGKEIEMRNPRKAKGAGVVLVPEDRQHDGLLMPQSISFNATLPSLDRLSNAGWLRPRALDEATSDYAERLHLVRRVPSQPVLQLSGGNQQKVVLSKWLMTNPSILILDEPTRGVDVGAKQEVHKLIRDLANNRCAVLMISSDLPEILTLSDRVLVMREGTLTAEINGGEATEEMIMNAASRGAA